MRSLVICISTLRRSWIWGKVPGVVTGAQTMPAFAYHLGVFSRNPRPRKLSHSFVTQRHDRIDAHRPPRGDIAGGDPHSYQISRTFFFIFHVQPIRRLGKPNVTEILRFLRAELAPSRVGALSC